MAAEWYLKAAEQGDVDAQFNMGVYFRNGTGVAQDLHKAAQWFQKAAEQGDAEALDALQKLGLTPQSSKPLIAGDSDALNALKDF